MFKKDLIKVYIVMKTIRIKKALQRNQQSNQTMLIWSSNMCKAEYFVKKINKFTYLLNSLLFKKKILKEQIINIRKKKDVKNKEKNYLQKELRYQSNMKT